MSTCEALLAWGREELGRADVPEAQLDAWYLLEECSGMSRAAYFLRCKEEMPPEKERIYREWIRRRTERIPLQHILGKAWFMGMEFLVSDQVLIPRQDTEVLVEETEKFLRPGMRILDMCTGSGCIVLSLLVLHPEIQGIGADCSGEALEVARKNAQKMIREGKISPGQIQWIQSDLFSEVTGTYSLLVSNPPYIPTGEIEGLMPEVRNHDPKMALDGREDGLYFYRRMIREAGRVLEPGGRVCFEIGHDQGRAVEALLKENHFAETKIIKDLAGLDRVVTARSRGI